MISREAALEIFLRQFPEGIGADQMRELDDAWYVPYSYIGSCGLAIDKRDGHSLEFGSAFPLEVWLWAYQRGFRWHSYDVIITAVRDRAATVALLDERGLRIADPGEAHRPSRGLSKPSLRRRLQSLPARFSNQTWWQAFDRLYQLRDAMPFDFSVEPDSHDTVPAGARTVRVDAMLLAALADDAALAEKLLALVDAGRLDVTASEADYSRAHDLVAGWSDASMDRQARKAHFQQNRSRRRVFENLVPCRLVDDTTVPRLDLAVLRDLVSSLADEP